ncbi:MAG: prolyl oligopeptidase family serine peptidase [Thermoplasmata archaeon]
MPPNSPAPYERYAQHWSYGDLAWLRPGELVFTANITGQFNLWRQTVGSKGERGFVEPLTAYTDRSVRAIVPTPDGRSIFFMADQDGDEQMQILRIAAGGGEPVAITNDRKVRHELTAGGIDPAARRLLFVDNGRDPADMDVVLLELARGTTARPLPKGALWGGPTWDASGRRFSALKSHSNTRIQTFVHDLAKKTTVEIVPHDTEEWAVAEAWTKDGRSLLMRTNIDREFKQLELVDVATGRRKVLAAPDADVEDVRYLARTSSLVYSVNEDGYSKIYAGRLGSPFRRIASLPTGSLFSNWGSSLVVSPDGRAAAAMWESGSRPNEIVWFPLGAGRSTQLTESMVGGVPGGPLPGPKLVRFRSFDGRQIPALYYVPKRRPQRPMPAVLSIHGGPEYQERPGWMYGGLYAWLNAHGIAVLAPNIRGSTGYGTSYQKLIHHDWGGAELKDLKAAADWMCARPEIDPARLGVFGGSFGGFATLSCVTRLPEYWKVGVDLVGPSNLVTFVKTVPPFWVRFMAQWVGDPETEADFLRDRSPITYIDNVRADLLVVQGANDPRVNKAESDQMVERLRAKGRKVEYMVFEDEGHGFTKRVNQLRAMGACGRFLVDHLRN